MEFIDQLKSPLKDEGIDYIWYAKYKDNSFKYEADDDKNKTSFDSVYKDRDKIKEFGLIGEGQRISYQLDTGLISMTDINGFDNDDFEFRLRTDNGTVNITENPDADYTDFTARKYVHADISLGQEVHNVIPEINQIAFGYTTNIKCDGINVKVEILYLKGILYLNHEDREVIKVSLTPDQDLDADLTFILVDTHIAGTIRVNLKKDQKSEYKIRL